MKISPRLFLVLSLAFSTTIAAQDTFLVDDFYTTSTAGVIGNVLDNDSPINGFTIGPGEAGWPYCFHIDSLGNLELLNLDDCCGTHEFRYYLFEGPYVVEFATVTVTVECGKPDCTFLDLGDMGGATGGIIGDGEGGCLAACEFTTSTAFLPYNPSSSYTWTVQGGVSSPGAHDAEIQIDWGASGSGFIFVDIIDANGHVQNLQFCVDILEAPEADFSFSGSPCLGANFQFNNTSSGADSYLWDFGDNSPTSTLEHPAHTFTAAGTYTVSLTAYAENTTSTGKPLCCCADTQEYEVVVDPLPGPEIHCVSTLCAFDNSSYWTDAQNCAVYDWTVTDADGNIVPILTGVGTDSINVDWGNGPFGTVTLQVSGCNPDLCDQPTSVIIPIISTVEEIGGAAIVCAYETAEYELPKWADTDYLWQVSGGTVIAGQGTHSVQIFWGSGPQGTINVTYSNSFLGGLPGADPGDCEGTAHLDVNVKPKFTMYTQSQACVGQTTTVWGASGGSGYSWTVDPSTPNITPIGDNAEIEWGASGLYMVTATPLVSTEWCNAEIVLPVVVYDVPEAPSIEGETIICPGATETYTALTTETGTTFYWSITGGFITGTTWQTSSNGSSISVDWNTTGPYELTLYQSMNSPAYCSSTDVNIQPVHFDFNGPYTLSGGPFCANDLAGFAIAPAPDPASVITWTIGDPLAGSVLSGQGDNIASIQWNNYTGNNTLSVTVELCGQTESIFPSEQINLAVVPSITQDQAICPGGTAELSVTGGAFSPISWNPGGSTPNSATTTISSGGTYSVTTVDANGCAATASHIAAEVPGPEPVITSGDPHVICITAPHLVTMVTPTNSNLIYQWYCNSGTGPQPQGIPTPNSSFTHPLAGVNGSWAYTVEAINTLTGCSGTSDPYFVFETDNCDPSPPCNTDPFTPVINMVQQSPNCNVFNFSDAGSFNFTATTWDFDDGSLASGQSGTYTYTQAGTYLVIMGGVVPEVPGPGNCGASESTVVTVPLAADFSYEFIPGTCNQVQFTDLSSWMAGAGNDVTGWFWDFSGSTSTLENPLVTLSGPGAVVVTLTVFNNNGCQAIVSKTLTTSGISTPTITATTTEICEGESLSLFGAAAGALNYAWDYGDGAEQLGEQGNHTYTTTGLFTVTLTATNEENCSASATISITVNPGVPPGAITASPATICEGDLATLSAPPGYSYLWSHDPLWTSNTVDVGGGLYSVELTDSNGCTRELDEIEVIEIPTPPAAISGNAYICGEGCVTLSAPFFWPMNYQWNVGGNAIPGETYSTLWVCDYDFPLGTTSMTYTVYMETDDGYACSDLSDPFTLELATPPAFTVVTNPQPACAGDNVTMTASPANSAWEFTWNTGATGPTLTTTVAGTYHLLGVDPVTGCTGSGMGVVHALPDLCAMPAGCYEVCEGDSVCAPGGLQSYVWLFNGGPMLGANDSCLVLNQSGQYNLLATDANGCESTSAPITADVINCDSTACAYGFEYEIICDADGNLLFYFDLCNPANAAFTVTGVSLSSLAPSSVSFQPNYIDQTYFAPAFNPLSPGQCAHGIEIALQVTGAYTPGDMFVFSMVATDGDLLCPLDTLGIPLPPCGGDCEIEFYGESWDGCCASIAYSNTSSGVPSMQISCAQAGINFDLFSLDPDHEVASQTPQSITLTGPSGLSLIPGNYPSVIEFCLENVTSSPQQVTISWYDAAGNICAEGVHYLYCEPDPTEDCLFLASDTVWCEGGQTYYSFTACNPVGSAFDVNYIVLDATSPAGLSISPSQFPASIPADGSCQSFTVQLLGPTGFGEIFCYHLIGHEENPAINPSTLCCSHEYCTELPGCNPCESVLVGLSSDPTIEDGCCYQIEAVNGFSSTAFDMLLVEIVSPSTTFESVGAAAPGWDAVATNTSITITPSVGGTLPMGNLNGLPSFCLETALSPYQQIAISWLSGGDVLCTDTLETFCIPPCGYVVDGSYACENGEIIFSGTVFNNTDYIIEEVVFTFEDIGMDIYNTSILIPPVVPGNYSVPFQVSFGAPAMGGEVLCITITLHELSPSGMHLNCCSFLFCDVVPPCDGLETCSCGNHFFDAVGAGFFSLVGLNNPLNVNTTFVDYSEIMQSCDVARWTWGDGASTVVPGPSSGAEHTYSLPGIYEVCVKVSRTESNGLRCKYHICQEIPVYQVGGDVVRVFPNPSDGRINLRFLQSWDGESVLSIRGIEGRIVQGEVNVNVVLGEVVSIDLSDEPPGIYTLTLRSDQDVVTVSAVVN